MLKYRVDILAALKEKGYSSYRMRKEKILGERVIQQLREKEPFSWEVLSRLCLLLDCQPGDLIESVSVDPGESVNAFINRAIDETMERDSA